MAEIPINYLKYIDQDGTEKKVYPITVTDAVYDSDGNKLSNVLLGVLKDTDISNVQSDSTTTVPSSALLKSTDDKIGDTSSLPGDAGNVVSAINQLNSDLVATAKTYTPTFTWSDNAEPPTVANIQARYCVSGKICFIYARYEITDLGNPGSNRNLRISFPEGIIPIVSTTSLISEYQTVSNLPEILGIRVSADKDMEIVTGIGGGYSGSYVPTGYQGFSIFFMFE